METLTLTAGVAQVIQLSVAPVFLLTAIAGMLSVLSGRLSRIIDRARYIQTLASSDQEKAGLTSHFDTSVLKRRIWLIQWAIRLYVIAALLICLVVVALFVGDFVGPNLSPAIAGFFIMAMLMLIAGLLLFILEVGLATRQTQLEIDFLIETRHG